jgi:hypothetical protein
MIRLHMVVEGQTEEAFVKRVLLEHLGALNIITDVRCVQTGRKRGRTYRGGIVSYAKLKNDLQRWMKEDQNPEAWFTSMVDLYALPEDFPGFSQGEAFNDPMQRVELLEQAFAQDIADHRFIPYLQLHEFETLVFVDPSKLDLEFIGRDLAIQALMRIRNQFATPEDIDDGEDTAPSKRIIKELPEYSGRKVTAGPRIAEAIGLDALRKECSHFDSWLIKLEQLAE